MSITPDEKSQLLSPEGACAFVGGDRPLKPSTLAGWRVKGYGPRWCKIGHLVRYRVADLVEWLESRVQQGQGR